MIDLKNYRDFLSEKASQVINVAIEESKKRNHYYLGVEHIFLAFAQVETTFFNAVLSELHLDPKHIIDFLKEHLSLSQPAMGVNIKIPLATKTIFRRAWEEAQQMGRKNIEPIDLFRAIFQESDGFPVRIFKNLGINPDKMVQTIEYKSRGYAEEREAYKKRFELPLHLKYFGVNLNKLARFGKLPLIIGRNNEIDQIIEILCHQDRSNSVMIIGEPGVGKTAVVEGLARRLELESESVPKRLRGYQIVNLQMNTLVAGTVFRGMFEDRIEKIINEVKNRKNIIIFIDEAHTIIGAGLALGVTSDAANVFKSSLSRGEVQIIGATTAAEYKTYIQEDEALDRRFRIVQVREPSLKETRIILNGIRTRLEMTYGVEVLDEAIDCALTMAPRYLHQLRLPDKAIRWLDTACVKAEIHDPHREVTPATVIDVIAQETTIPKDMIGRDPAERLKNMEEALAKKVVGQKEAITTLARRIRLNKGPLKEDFERPDGVSLFLGPTGVGKTELAKVLAEFLFGDEKKIVRLDMSEYKDSTISVDKLIGMPRGIVGSERGGILTNQIRDNPYTVLLIDEMEKASPFVLNLFLQVFDEGFLTDGRGKRVYFSDAIIIMTSNLGSDEFKRYTQPLGFLNDPEGVKSVNQAIIKEVERSFSPEFLNRIDDIVVFSPLTFEDVETITKMYLEDIHQQLHTHGKCLHYSGSAAEYLAREGYSIKYGARFLKRKIDELVKIPITLRWKEGDNFYIEADEETLAIHQGATIPSFIKDS